jgi:hypothetical protein
MALTKYCVYILGFCYKSFSFTEAVVFNHLLFCYSSSGYKSEILKVNSAYLFCPFIEKIN